MVGTSSGQEPRPLSPAAHEPWAPLFFPRQSWEDVLETQTPRPSICGISNPVLLLARCVWVILCRGRVGSAGAALADWGGAEFRDRQGAAPRTAVGNTLQGMVGCSGTTATICTPCGLATTPHGAAVATQDLDAADAHCYNKDPHPCFLCHQFPSPQRRYTPDWWRLVTWPCPTARDAVKERMQGMLGKKELAFPG